MFPNIIAFTMSNFCLTCLRSGNFSYFTTLEPVPVDRVFLVLTMFGCTLLSWSRLPGKWFFMVLTDVELYFTKLEPVTRKMVVDGTTNVES